jgi:hypothetical protein
MTLGYDGKLYIVAFDHRGSFQKKMFGIEGDPTPNYLRFVRVYEEAAQGAPVA